MTLTHPTLARQLGALAGAMAVRFDGQGIWLDGETVSDGQHHMPAEQRHALEQRLEHDAPLRAAVDLAASGRLQDAKTLIGLQSHFRLRILGVPKCWRVKQMGLAKRLRRRAEPRCIC